MAVPEALEVAESVTACAWIALGQGPGNALTWGSFATVAVKSLRLRQLKRHRCRGNSDGGGRLWRRRASGRGSPLGEGV